MQRVDAVGIGVRGESSCFDELTACMWMGADLGLAAQGCFGVVHRFPLSGHPKLGVGGKCYLSLSHSHTDLHFCEIHGI